MRGSERERVRERENGRMKGVMKENEWGLFGRETEKGER